MTMSYDAHPLNHAGEPELTVIFKMPSGLTDHERRALFLEAEDEVQRRERVAKIFPLERVVFSAHDDDPTPQRGSL